MGASRVIFNEKLAQTLPEFPGGGVVIDINILVFYSPPEPFRKNIIHTPPSAVHADFYACRK